MSKWRWAGLVAVGAALVVWVAIVVTGRVAAARYLERAPRGRLGEDEPPCDACVAGTCTLPHPWEGGR